MIAEAYAVGVQIYVAKPKPGEAGLLEWALKGPEADLFDSEGKQIGTHFLDEANSGPAWQLNDQSKVVGNTATAKRHPVANSIPWLYVPAKVAEGPGVLGKVKSIHRLATVGGKAPVQPPSAKQAGSEVRVYYSATYYFNG